MKKWLAPLMVMALLLGLWPAQAQEVSFQVFHDSLQPYGRWVQLDPYGTVWQPEIADGDWQPYTNGYWADTEDGMLWVSDESEPWGDITYHYGRWIFVEGHGWFWVPDYEWAPSWVSWRYDDEYSGWAPLPPPTYYGVISFTWYNFCPNRYMGRRSFHGHIVPGRHHRHYYDRTRDCTPDNARFSRRPVRGGPPVDRINRVSEQRIPRYDLRRDNSRPARAGVRNFRPRVEGNVVTVTAPSASAPSQQRPQRDSRPQNQNPQRISPAPSPLGQSPAPNTIQQTPSSRSRQNPWQRPQNQNPPQAPSQPGQAPAPNTIRQTPPPGSRQNQWQRPQNQNPPPPTSPSERPPGLQTAPAWTRERERRAVTPAPSTPAFSRPTPSPSQTPPQQPRPQFQSRPTPPPPRAPERISPAPSPSVRPAAPPQSSPPSRGDGGGNRGGGDGERHGGGGHGHR